MTESKPTLLVVASTYPRWKDDTEPSFVHQLCQRLTDKFQVEVIAPHAPGAATTELLDGVRVYRFRYFLHRGQTLAYEGGLISRMRAKPWRAALLPLFFIAQICSVARHLRRREPTVIHAHWIIPQGAAVLLARRVARRKTPVLCTAHGGDLYALRHKLFRKVKQTVLGRADAVTVVSSAMLRDARALVPSVPATVISMGVDLSGAFTPDPRVPREPFTIACAGRLIEKKGIQHVIDAAPALQTVYPNLKIIIAGDGPYRERLQQRAQRLGLNGTIDFLGAVSQREIAMVFRRAAVAVFPFSVAHQEGLGLVVIEAMGCECPVVVGDVDAIHDMVIDEETGLLTRQGDSHDIAAKVCRLLDEPRLARRLAASARAHVISHFDWDSVADRYSELIMNLTNRRSRQTTSPE